MPTASARLSASSVSVGSPLCRDCVAASGVAASGVAASSGVPAPRQAAFQGRRFLWLVAFLLLFVASCQGQEKKNASSHDLPPYHNASSNLRTGADVLLGLLQEQKTGNPSVYPQGTTAKESLGLLLENYKGKRVAVVANQTSVLNTQASVSGNTHLVDTLIAVGVKVVKIFCPEHGFRGTAAAGAHVANSIDPKTGLPIISLYGKNKKPTPEQLKDVDLVVFDLQDVGCRFYTYLSTMHYVMEACAESALPLLVLDRPNPNGHYVDGPVLDTSTCRSFVGMHPVPIVYGLTIGEYALMINGEHWLAGGKECRLTVVPLGNYHRDSAYHLSVPPSPNLRNDHAIALYPSLCLFEGTSVSVGRGTDSPFEIIGLPTAMCARSCSPATSQCTYWRGSQNVLRPGTCTSTSFFVAQGQKVPGFHFTPKGGKSCFGADLREVVPQKRIDLSFIETMYSIAVKETFFLKNNFFDKLAGTRELRRQLERGLSEEEIRASWQPALERYRQIRKKYLIYPDIEQ